VNILIKHHNVLKNAIPLIASENITRILQNITFPVFSTIQDDNIKLKSGYAKVLRVTMFVNVPIMFILILLAKPIIVLLITDKWLQTVPYLQLLCIAGMIYPLQSINLNILKVKGLSGLFLRLELIKKALIIIAILVTFRFGVKGLIVGQVIVGFLSFFVNSYYSGRILSYSMTSQIKDILPFFIISLPMIIFMMLVNQLGSLSNLLKIFSSVLFSLIVYTFLARLFCSDELKEIRSLMQKVKNMISSKE